MEQLIRAWPVPVQLRYSAPEPPGLSPQVRLAAFRTLQEALTNALKHAPGQEVTVELEPSGQGLTLRVTNNQEGGAALPAGTGRHGLTGLRERLAEVGGSLQLACPPGRFELCAEFPLHPLDTEPARLETK